MLSDEPVHRSADYMCASAQVFEQFLEGETLEECYAAVAAVANRWLDLLDTQVSRTETSQKEICCKSAQPLKGCHSVSYLVCKCVDKQMILHCLPT